MRRTGRGAVRTIRSNREVDAVFREGSRVSHPLLIAIIRHTPLERGLHGRVAFIAGKKLGGAVLRNRSKRVIRAAAQRAGAPWHGIDAVLIARPATAEGTPEGLDEAMGLVQRQISRYEGR